MYDEGETRCIYKSLWSAMLCRTFIHSVLLDTHCDDFVTRRLENVFICIESKIQTIQLYA